MKAIIFSLATSLTLVSSFLFQNPQEAQVNTPSIAPSFALVELFTSQGCSSCPPADKQLARLAETYDEVYALSFHVDYWNYLGWADPYSAEAYTHRQYEYSSYLNDRVYTPQMVVNGQKAFIGSRRNEAEAAVEAALKKQPTLRLDAQFEQIGKNLKISYNLSDLPEKGAIYGAIVQKDVNTAVVRGENRGRDLHHVQVVRQFQGTALLAQEGSLQLELPADVEAGNWEVIVFVQDRNSGAILGVNRGIEAS